MYFGSFINHNGYIVADDVVVDDAIDDDDDDDDDDGVGGCSRPEIYIVVMVTNLDFSIWSPYIQLSDKCMLKGYKVIFYPLSPLCIFFSRKVTFHYCSANLYSNPTLRARATIQP